MRRRTLALSAAIFAIVVPACVPADDWQSPNLARSRVTPWVGATEEPSAAAPDPTGRPDVDPDAYPSTASEWGEAVTGVKTRLDTAEQVIALTLDACAEPGGTGYDEELIEYLIAEEIPATLFVTQRWIESNEDVFEQLADEELFEIANHGTECRPLSVTGQSAHGITGTDSPAAVIDEVLGGEEAIESRTGHTPEYFRSGTAHYDEVAVEIVGDLGLEVVGFDVRGDAGGTFTAAQVTAALVNAGPGSIALVHMNRPGSGTADGVRAAVPDLRDRGFTFVALSDYPLA